MLDSIAIDFDDWKPASYFSLIIPSFPNIKFCVILQIYCQEKMEQESTQI